MKPSTYQQFAKRWLDVTLVAAAAPLVLPLLAVVAVLIRWKLGSPILFRQRRTGLNGDVFEIIKFRTMTDDRQSDGTLRSDAERLTRFGRFLRSTSLDELPELWNVLRGEMSLVGPRPLLPEYLDRYTPQQARRHEVQPGLTGWAQVHGRNAIDWETRFTLDVWYVDHCSLAIDCRILLRTVLAVFTRRGITADNHASCPPFMGTASMLATCTEAPSDGVYVIGAGGHAKVVIDTLQAAGRQVLAVFDDDPRRWGDSLLGVPIEGPISAIPSEKQAVIAVGDNGTRRRLAETLQLRWVTVIHPAATVAASAIVDEGAVIFAGAVVQPDARIGRHVVINTSASIDHDCVIEPFAHVAPGCCLAGNVTVGSETLLGIGSRVVPNVIIGEQVVVGAGGVVIRSVESGHTVVGVPAEPMRQSNSKKAA